MSNPIFDVMGNTPMNNNMRMIQQFNDFRRNFHGDARSTVQQLLNSGKMTQQQFNQLSQMANQFQRMIK